MGKLAVYHQDGLIRVVDEAAADQLVASGKWSKENPKLVKVKAKESQNDERQIRWKPRKGRRNGQNPTQSSGSGT
jgi:hypothetical protein